MSKKIQCSRCEIPLASALSKRCPMASRFQYPILYWIGKYSASVFYLRPGAILVVPFTSLTAF